MATGCVELYQAGMAPLILFTGANSPTTAQRFPRGEAVHYREHALALGVPDQAILVEPRATNTGQNITLSRELLEAHGVRVNSVLPVSKPYEQRRSYATCRKLWPSVDVVCASERVTLGAYVQQIGDVTLVIDMLVGTLQRVIEYPRRGFAIPQDVPAGVLAACERLAASGFSSRLLKT